MPPNNGATFVHTNADGELDPTADQTEIRTFRQAICPERAEREANRMSRKHNTSSKRQQNGGEEETTNTTADGCGNCGH